MTGRVSYIFKRCSKAKNKLSKPYFPKQESKHITYLESNNLYGYTISKFIPTKRFKWIDPKDFDSSIYIAAIVQQVVFQKWISYLLNYYVNCAMIILYKIEIKIKKKKKCCLNINYCFPICILFLVIMLKNWCLTFLIRKII